MARVAPSETASRMEETLRAAATDLQAPVQLEAVTKQFANGREAISHVDLTVDAGEFVSLVGPSGCGKSTLLRIVAGLSPATSGRVSVFGQEPTEARRTTNALAYVFQQPTLMPWRTVLDNVALPLELSGVSVSERHRRALVALQQVGLPDTAELFPAQLSGGMSMRVSIARALCAEPRLLLMDEPFAAIDEITRRQMNEDLHRLWCANRFTTLFVTHNIYEAVFLSTQIVVLTHAPARIVDVITIDEPPERTDEFLSSPRFSALVSRVWKLLDR